jgi:hypothetical protein
MVSEHRPIDRWRASAGSERCASSIRTISADSPYSAREREAPVNRARTLVNQARTSIVEAATPLKRSFRTAIGARTPSNRRDLAGGRLRTESIRISTVTYATGSVCRSTPNVGQASHRSGHAAPNGDRGARPAVARTPNIEHRVRHVPHSTPNAGPGSIS